MKNGAWFPYMLIGLLLVSVGANVYLIIRATNDPSFAVEPDYYAKAVDWDVQRAEQAASDRLGWNVDMEFTATELRVHLLDSAGIPVDGATVEVEVFHNARAQNRIAAVMRPDGPGEYVLNRPFEREGLWEVRLSAVRRDDRFVHVQREELR
ncbi:MAG: FixH family protein [Myxococcota bacterium]